MHLNDNVSCAHCGEDYIHQNGLIWFQRGEDDGKGDAYYVEWGRAGKLTFDNAFSANPSRRRHGMLVTFSCELCGGSTSVVFSQHKGITETGVIKTPEGLIVSRVDFEAQAIHPDVERIS